MSDYVAIIRDGEQLPVVMFGAEGPEGAIGPAGTMADATGRVNIAGGEVSVSGGNTHTEVMRFTHPDKTNTFNVSVSNFPAYSAAGDTTSWYLGPNVQAGGGRTDATRAATYMFIEENFQEVGRPIANEWHVGHNGTDSGHIRPISIYSPVGGAVAGQFTYFRFGELQFYDWVTGNLRWSVAELTGATAQHDFKATEEFLFRKSGAFIRHHNGTSEIPMPYANADGTTQLTDGNAKVASSLDVGTSVSMGSNSGNAFPELNLGTAVSHIPTFNIKASPGGVGAVSTLLQVRGEPDTLGWGVGNPVVRVLTTDEGMAFGKIGGANWLEVNLNGINLASGKVLKVNSVQVVGAQGAAVADATDAASVITQLNALLARMRAHGLIAT